MYLVECYPSCARSLPRIVRRSAKIHLQKGACMGWSSLTRSRMWIETVLQLERTLCKVLVKRAFLPSTRTTFLTAEPGHLVGRMPAKVGSTTRMPSSARYPGSEYAGIPKGEIEQVYEWTLAWWPPIVYCLIGTARKCLLQELRLHTGNGPIERGTRSDLNIASRACVQ